MIMENYVKTEKIELSELKPQPHYHNFHFFPVLVWWYKFLFYTLWLNDLGLF